MNKFLIPTIVIVVIGISGFFVFGKPSSEPSMQTPVLSSPTSISTEATQPAQDETVNYQAVFAIYTNSVFRVFTAPMYHNLSKDVYIQADNPNIVLVKKSGVSWNDFFNTLPFSVTKDCLITWTKDTFCTNPTKTLKFYLIRLKN